MAHINKVNKDFVAALDLLDKALNIDNQSVPVIFSIGNVMLEMKENEQAMECFKNCISIEPNHISSLLNISHILIHQENYEDAIYLNSLLKYDPKNTNALNNFGVCSLKMRSLDDASNSFLISQKFRF